VSTDGHLHDMRDGALLSSSSFPRYNQAVDLSTAFLSALTVSTQILLYALEDGEGSRPPRVFIPIGVFEEPIGLWVIVVTLIQRKEGPQVAAADAIVKETIENAKCIGLRISEWLSACEAAKHMKFSQQVSCFSRLDIIYIYPPLRLF
jgi:hypothetical protein